MTTRGLTDGERAIASCVFGNAVAFDRVLIHHRAWMPFQPKAVTMSPNGHIYFPAHSPNHAHDFAAADPQSQGHFIHELTHVWQHQRGLFMPVARLPFSRYRYTLKPGRSFDAYGLEQQAEMVRHAFMQRHCCVVAPHYAPLDALEALLPFDPWRSSASR